MNFAAGDGQLEVVKWLHEGNGLGSYEWAFKSGDMVVREYKKLYKNCNVLIN